MKVHPDIPVQLSGVHALLSRASPSQSSEDVSNRLQKRLRTWSFVAQLQSDHMDHSLQIAVETENEESLRHSIEQLNDKVRKLRETNKEVQTEIGILRFWIVEYLTAHNA